MGLPEMDAAGLHINPLEFIAAIINLWLLLKCIQHLSPIVDLWSDNTSALSWMKVTAATRNPDLQPLARFALALLVQTSRCGPGFESRHCSCLSPYGGCPAIRHCFSVALEHR
jgi:hypothetical protein